MTEPAETAAAGPPKLPARNPHSLPLLKHPAAPLVGGLLLCVGLAALLFSVDALSPAELPQGFSSRQQLIGMVLLLILLPPYLVIAWGLSERRSWRLLGQVDQLLELPEYQSRLAAPKILLVTGAALGIVYAVVFNLPVSSLQDLLAGGPLLIALVACMILVWLTVGVTLVARVRVAGLFLEAGRKVPIDLYDQTPLEPFGRAGMGDMLMVVGALVLSTVQSIDAMFRYQNYLFALAVAVPAALLLLMRPMASLHTRLKARKARELEAVNALIRAAPKDLEPDAMLGLETLLKRRERVQGAYTWPMNLAIVSRLVLYGIIPPAAWVAAAIVERLIGTLFGG